MAKNEEQITIPRADFDRLIDAIVSPKPNTIQITECLFTIKEASRYLRCSTVSFLKIRKQTGIQPIYVGKKMLFPKTALDQYLGICNKGLYTPRELFEQLAITRLKLLDWEERGLIKLYLPNGIAMYNFSEVYAALRAEIEKGGIQ